MKTKKLTIAEKLNKMATENPEIKFYVTEADGSFFAYWNEGNSQVYRKLNSTTFNKLKWIWYIPSRGGL